MNSRLSSLLKGFTSLRLTVILLILSMVLVFAATLDQVHLGIWAVQQKYFHSFFVFAFVPGTPFLMPMFPGGYLLGLLLLANLLAAHFYRFKLSAKKAGIWLTHLGLILLLVGEGISGLMQKDDQMRLDVGQTRRYSESFRENELALVDTSAAGYDEVTSIPVSRLAGQAPVQSPRLPFLVKPVAYYPNANVQMRTGAEGGPPNLATAGQGLGLWVLPAAVTAKPDEANWPTAYVELVGPEGSLGIFLVSSLLRDPETVTYQGHTWLISLRAKRDYLPFAVTLKKFTHEIYPGTDIPRDFASTIQLKSDDGRDDREVRIFMNRPLRYAGRAVYQAGYANNDRTAVLQVVRNPGWQIPYLSCGLMALGLMVQFGLQLFAFFRRRSTAGNRSGQGRRTPAPSAGVIARPLGT